MPFHHPLAWPPNPFSPCPPSSKSFKKGEEKPLFFLISSVFGSVSIFGPPSFSFRSYSLICLSVGGWSDERLSQWKKEMSDIPLIMDWTKMPLFYRSEESSTFNTFSTLCRSSGQRAANRESRGDAPSKFVVVC